MSASRIPARSRAADPDRVSPSMLITRAGDETPSAIASASDGNVSSCSTSVRTSAVIVLTANAAMPPANSHQGRRRRGRFRRTPYRITATVAATRVAKAGSPAAGTNR